MLFISWYVFDDQYDLFTIASLRLFVLFQLLICTIKSLLTIPRHIKTSATMHASLIQGSQRHLTTVDKHSAIPGLIYNPASQSSRKLVR